MKAAVRSVAGAIRLRIMLHRQHLNEQLASSSNNVLLHRCLSFAIEVIGLPPVCVLRLLHQYITTPGSLPRREHFP